MGKWWGSAMVGAVVMGTAQWWGIAVVGAVVVRPFPPQRQSPRDRVQSGTYTREGEPSKRGGRSSILYDYSKKF